MGTAFSFPPPGVPPFYAGLSTAEFSLIDTQVKTEPLVARSLPRSLTSREQGMRVFQIDPLRDPRWKVFIDSHPDAAIFHRIEWLQALKSTYGYTPIALTLTAPGSPLENGVAFCEIRSRLTGNRLVSVPFSDHCEPLVGNPAETKSLMAGMVEAVSKDRWKYAEIRPVNYVPDVKANFGMCNTYCLHRLDLRSSEQQLFKGFNKGSVQRKIRRAERESLRYEEGSSDELLHCFYQLLIMTRRRHGLPPQPLKWFRSLIDCLGQDLKIRIALKGDTPVASMLTIAHKKTLVYKYGCSDLRYSNLGGTALVFWRAIQDAKAAGIEALDMGRSDLEDEGLVTFKENWGAARSTMKYWRYPARSTKPGPENLIRHVKRLVSIAPDISLVMLSNLLYRHIG